MKNLILLILLIGQFVTANSQSNIKTYKHGVDDLLIVDKRNPENYVLVNVFGCRPEIRDDIGMMILKAYHNGELGTVKFQTKIGETVGELFYIKKDKLVVVSYIFTKVNLIDGSILIYKPYHD
jgi:hypothetical protein